MTSAGGHRGATEISAAEIRATEIDVDTGRGPRPGGAAPKPRMAAPARVLARAGRTFGRWWETPAALDVAICLFFVTCSLWLTRSLWPDPATRALADNVNDQALIEWFLAHGVLFWTGDFSLVTDRLNSPDGVNLMSNASHILHGVLMAPVTVLFGAPVSFALLTAGNLAATAAGWYLLLARTLHRHRGAALVGGLFAGFAPGMISQSNSHLHMTAQWLVPPIVWCLLRLTRVVTVRAIATTAVGLGLLLAAQVFLGEEVLFLTALTMALFATGYALRRPAWARKVAPRFLTGLTIAAGVCGAAVAYPLWVQFAGRQHTPNAPFGPEFFYADLASFTVFSPLSLAGSPDAAGLAANATELNTYLGLPLVLLVLACAIWQRRSPIVLAATLAGLVMFWLSLGPSVFYDNHRTGLPSLYALIAGVPVINGALPTRYALALIPLIAVVLAYALHAAWQQGGYVRVALPLAVVAALAPVVPKPLAGTTRAPVPAFITAGGWRQCTPEGGVLVPVPLPTPGQPDPMRWAAAANAAFALPEGFFIGPYGPNGHSSIGTYSRPTSRLLADVARSGQVPLIDDTTRAQAQRDLAFWRADCVALAHVGEERALRQTLEELLGPGRPIDDTWTWSVRARR
ncbi:MAG: hypothetical protein ACM30G_21650 [Micromonosporaceae bacterium]